MMFVMTTKTLKDAIEAKLRLQQDILGLIREFEYDYGVTVSDVGLSHVQTISGDSETVAVQVKVEV